MESETFSTLSTISEKLRLDLNHNLIKVCSKSRKIKIDGRVLYNENDVARIFIDRKKYLYIRIDSNDQDNIKDEWIKEFKEKFSGYNIIIGISLLDKINDSLITLLHMCMKKHINEITFYSKTNSASKEIMEILIMFAKFNNITLSYYKN